MAIASGLMDAAVAAAGTGMFTGFIAIIRSQMKLNKNITKLVKMDELRAGDLEAIARVQRPMLVGVKASLEALRDGESNGNVTDAHIDITEAMRNYDGYLASLVRRGR